MGRRRKTVEPETAKIGHNSNLNSEEQRSLQGYIEEIERHEAEKKTISQDISEIYKSAKERGFDTKAMRHVVKFRAMEKDKRVALEAAIDAYTLSLGALADTPLGKSATAREFPAHA